MTARIDSPTTHAPGGERPRTAPVERARDGDVRALHGTPLPLTDVRVLDLGHVFQGPYATFLMAMAGAEVIKIEPPRGDMSRRRARDGDADGTGRDSCDPATDAHAIVPSSTWRRLIRPPILVTIS